MKKLKFIARPYQSTGIKQITKWFKTGKKAFLLADDTGLGKTPQSLGVLKNLAKHYKDEDELLFLVIAPAFLVPKWIAEIKKFLPASRKYKIIIKSYSDLINPDQHRFVCRHKYLLTIVDEMHYLKSFDSLRTQAILGAPASRHPTIFKQSKYILGMSATPIPNRVGEIYPWLWSTKNPAIIDLTYDDFLNKYASFVEQSNYGITTHKGVKNAGELKKIIGSAMLRRKKHDVMKDLPPGTRNYIPIECDRKVYKEEEELLLELLNRAGYEGAEAQVMLKSPALFGIILETVPSFEQMSRFKKSVGLLKFKPVLEYLKNILLEKRKFVIFTYHTDVAEMYLQELEKIKSIKKVPKSLITGAVDASTRFEIIEQANKDDEHILICSMHSVKEGLDFIGFDTAYFAETDWGPATLEQVEGRLLRYGQINPVFWNYFLLPEGLENYIFKTVQEKNRAINQLIA